MKTLNQVNQIQRQWTQREWDVWESRCQYHERDGNDRSDAQGMVDVDMMYERKWCAQCGRLMTEADDGPLPPAAFHLVCDNCAFPDGLKHSLR